MVALGVGALLLLGVTAAAADTQPGDLTCNITNGVLACPLPEPITGTVTVTQAAGTETVTVTPDPVTVVSTEVGPTTTVLTTVTATPEPSATPTSASSPPVSGCSGTAGAEGGTDPWGTCWPGPANTGVPPGITPTVVNGNQTYGTANAVIDGKDIRGCVTITAPGVVIKNSRIACGGNYVVYYHGSGGARVTLQDVTISCNVTQGTGIGDVNITVTRANISGCENGFDADNDITITDSYIHDLFQGGTAHTDGIQSAVASRLVLDHNVWYANNGSSAVNLKNSTGGPLIVDTTVSRNLIAGGSYSLYCPIPATQNFKITDNRFSRKFYPTVGEYGPDTDCNGETWSGNTYADTGMPVPMG